MNVPDEPTDRPQQPQGQPPEGGGQQAVDWSRVAPAIVAALIVAFVVWLLVRGNGDEEETAATGPVAATLEDISELASERGHPIYWLGERPDTQLELSVTAEGNVYVRYLPTGVEIGDPDPGYLTVGTYPLGDGYAATQGAAEAEGARVESGPNDAFVVANIDRPMSVYVAYPDSPLQIEVYDPDPEVAMDLATSEDLQPIG